MQLSVSLIVMVGFASIEVVLKIVTSQDDGFDVELRLMAKPPFMNMLLVACVGVSNASWKAEVPL